MARQIVLLAMILLTVLLLMGCGKKPAQYSTAPENSPTVKNETQETENEYIVHTIKNEDGTYTCMDNSVKKTAQECLDVAIDIITKQRLNETGLVYKTTVVKNEDGTYTCSDDRIVNGSDECIEAAMQKAR